MELSEPRAFIFLSLNPDSQTLPLIPSAILAAMPAHDIANSEMTDLVAFIHTKRPIRGCALTTQGAP